MQESIHSLFKQKRITKEKEMAFERGCFSKRFFTTFFHIVNHKANINLEVAHKKSGFLSSPNI